MLLIILNLLFNIKNDPFFEQLALFEDEIAHPYYITHGIFGYFLAAARLQLTAAL